MSKLRFGILGSGYMGRTHAEAIRHLDSDAALVAIWGGSRAPGLAQHYGIACESSMESLVRRSDVDAVVVATPHHLHAGEALLALQLGKHVLVEKPITTTVEDCDRLLEAAERTRAVIGVVYQQRFRRNNVRACELVRSGAIGRVLTVHVAMPLYKGALQSGGFGGNWAWWDDPASVGHVINSAPHAIDLMRWMTGSDIVNVSAFCRTFSPGHSVEDTTLALMEFSNGMLFSLFSSNAFPRPPFPNEDFRFRMVGTKGLIDLDPYGELRIDDGGGWRVESRQPTVGHQSADAAFNEVRMQAYWDQMQAFIDGIRGKPLRCGSGRDGRAGIATCQAMFQSSRERRWVQP